MYRLQDKVINLASVLGYIFLWDQFNFLGIVQCLLFKYKFSNGGKLYNL